MSSLAVLGVYTVVVYRDNENKLGLITSVSVVLLDSFNFLMFKFKIIEKPIGIVSLLIVTRVLMISFGEGYWIFGYMVLYICYAVLLGWLIAKNHFPFEGDVILKEVKPKLLILGLTVAYGVLMAIFTFLKIDGVNINSWDLFGMGVEISF